MDVREWSNTHPKTAFGVTAAGVVFVLGAVVFQLLPDRGPAVGVAPPHYFTVDDGASYFTAPGSNVPPFDYGGQTAVRVHLFECDGKRFVGYLERYTPEARKAEIAKTITPQQEVEGREIKRPAEPKWVSTGDHAAAGKLLNVRSPTGSASLPMPVEP